MVHIVPKHPSVKEEYNQAVATHYAAYRPPLHRPILEKLLKEGERFESGLDIGCGTGYSSIALANHCDQVIGLDPSKSMIDQSIPAPSITFILGNETKLSEFDSESFDVVTFAGSLYYAKNLLLYQQLLRTLMSKGVILVYDFEVLLNEPFAQLELKQTAAESGYHWPRFRTETSHMEAIELSLSSEELSHVLLADSNLYTLIVDKLRSDQPYTPLVDHFQSISKIHTVKANLYYSRLSRT